MPALRTVSVYSPGTLVESRTKKVPSGMSRSLLDTSSLWEEEEGGIGEGGREGGRWREGGREGREGGREEGGMERGRGGMRSVERKGGERDIPRV